MFGQFKDKRFLVSGLKEGCDGLLGIERSSGRRGREEGPSPPQSSASTWSGPTLAQEPQICLVRKQDWALEKILCVPCPWIAWWSFKNTLSRVIYFTAIAPCYAYWNYIRRFKKKKIVIFFHKTKCEISLTNNDGNKKYLTWSCKNASQFTKAYNISKVFPRLLHRELYNFTHFSLCLNVAVCVKNGNMQVRWSLVHQIFSLAVRGWQWWL